MKVAFTTLGCKVNQDESAGMQVLFEDAGFETVDFKDLADVYIVNTCTVTHLGSRKSRQLLRQARRRNEMALVVAVGCYPQVASEELSGVTEVDLIIGNSHKPEIVPLVEAALKDKDSTNRVVVEEPEIFQDLPVSVATSRHRATMKIQEGCQRYCTYCIVPKARGRLRSMPIESIIDKARALVDSGFREIVLTGINLTSYGRETSTGVDLAAVINALAPEVRPARIRISSVEPTDFNEGLMKAIEDNPEVCLHFHIPLQSGSDPVLKLMGRKYTTDEFSSLVDSLKTRFDKPSFSTDVIVGFPGETDEHFHQTRELIKSVGFCKLHVFKYSPRPGTPAASFKNQVPAQIAAKRSQDLIDLGEELASSYAKGLLGYKEQILLEETSTMLESAKAGYGQRYLRIHCKTNAKPGSLLDVQITGHFGSDLMATEV